MANTADAPLDDLLKHRGWVQRLARSLVADQATADDVEQEVWMRALRAPPRIVGAAKGWLGRVLRNVVRDRSRGESRRSRREDDVRRSEATESTFEVVARAEAHRRLVDVVVALRAPYRRVVLLRFFDGLAPQAIADRDGTSADTVRKQIRRAKALLREGLEKSEGRGWALALAPLIGKSSATRAVLTGGALVTAKSKLGVVAAVLLLIALLTATGVMIATSDPEGPRDDDSSREIADGGSGSSSSGDATADGSGGGSVDGDGDASGVRGDGARPNGSGDTADGDSDADSTSTERREIIGVVLDPDGVPLENVTVIARRPGADPTATVRTTAGGRFQLPKLPLGTYEVVVLSDRYLTATIRVKAGSDLIQVSLARHFRIRGTLVDDTSDDPVPDALVVAIAALGSTRAYVARSDARGAFAFEELPAGKYVLQIGYPTHLEGEPFAYKAHTMSDVSAGSEEVVARLTPGHSIGGRLLDELGQPVKRRVAFRATARTEHGDVDLTRTRLFIFEIDGAFELSGLDAGTYDLTISFEGDEETVASGGTTTFKDATTGTMDLEIRLGHTAVIAGRLVDDLGEPVRAKKGYLLAVPQGIGAGEPGSIWVPFQLDGVFTSPPLDADTVYDLSTGNMPGYMRAKLTGVRPGTTDIELRIARSKRLAGVVRRVDGKPVPSGTAVRASAVDARDPNAPGATGLAYTTIEGKFEMTALGDFTFRVAAGGGGGWFASTKTATEVAAGTMDLSLEIGYGKTLTGRLVDAHGNGVQSPSLRAVRDGVDQVESNVRVTSEDGSFAIRSLHEGTYRLWAVVGGRAIDCGEVTVPAEDVVLTIELD